MIRSNLIRILLVDDHAVVRSGLRMFLMAFDDLELVGEAVNGIEAVNLAGKLNPDVILMDLIMPTMDGLQATQTIHQNYPQIKIIALTSFTESQLIHNTIKAGVSGLLFKDTTANELANAIRSVHSGKKVFSPLINLTSEDQPKNPVSHFTELSARESEVLGLLVRGKSNAEISEKLTLSLSTTKFHVSNILSKLGARSRGEAVSIAQKNSIVK